MYILYHIMHILCDNLCIYYVYVYIMYIYSAYIIIYIYVYIYNTNNYWDIVFSYNH
jgi:hypothetical protein